MAELIVLRAFLRIREDLICFRNLLERLLGLFVSRVSIGMMLERQLAIGFLYFFLARVSLDAEQFVVIPFAVQVSDPLSEWFLWL